MCVERCLNGGIVFRRERIFEIFALNQNPPKIRGIFHEHILGNKSGGTQKLEELDKVWAEI